MNGLELKIFEDMGFSGSTLLIIALVALFIMSFVMIWSWTARKSIKILGSIIFVCVLLILVWMLIMNAPATGVADLSGFNRLQGILVVIGFLIGGLVFTLIRADTQSGYKMHIVSPFSFTGLVSDVLGRNKSSRRSQSAASKPKRLTGAIQGGKNQTKGQGAEVKFQEYDVIDRVGVGGMGSVYRARRKQDGKIVALKVPQDRYLADSKFVKRFYREAEVLKRFNHPNIVQVYDYRMQAPEHYIAMEFLDGGSLEDLLEERALTFKESLSMLRALADALRHIHMQNVVHRDIKPANIMVLRDAFRDGEIIDGGVKLMDFGIAVGKVLTRLTMTGARVGTPIYMSPEQAKGTRVDSRSDVYSLGLVAYELVTGSTAFRGNYEAVVHQQVFESPKPPKQVRMDIPGKLSDLILSMIEKDPAQRPTLDSVVASIDAGVLKDEDFTDPVALAVSIDEKRGTLRLLDLQGKLRLSLRDQSTAEKGLPSAPLSLASDPEGNIYAATLDFKQGQPSKLIRCLNPQGREILAFGKYGLSEGELLQPVSMTFYAGYLYVVDGEAHFVNIYDSTGKFIKRFGGRGPGMGRFDKPRTIVAAPDGHLYVLDVGNHEVQRFTPKGDYLSRYAFRLDRNSETLRQLDGLGIDAQGGVYIVDNVARKVRKIEADGTPGVTFPLEAMIGEPTDAVWLLQVSADNTIYAIKQGGQTLRLFTSTGDLINSKDLYAPVQAMTFINRPDKNASDMPS